MEHQVPSKKLLILSCLGGYGHIAATNTIKDLLGSEYEIDTFYPIKELRIFGMPSGESFYNFTISNNWTRLTNWYVKWLSFPIFAQREGKLTALIEREIKRSQPDLIISILPFVNYPASEAARKLGVPFLLVTTDNDLYNWVFGLEKRKCENFKVTIGSNLPTTKGMLLNHLVPEEAIETTGFPLRPNFFQTRGKRELREEYHIPQNKKVVLVVMGGVGGRCSYKYARTIMESDLGVHLIVCAGKNKKLFKKLKTIEPAHRNSITVLPFTEKLHELFALSDLVISKSGPGTINEVLSLKIPILLDHTRIPLFWEQVNFDWVLGMKVGAAIRSFEEAPALVRRFLYDEKTCAEVAQGYAKLPKNEFAERIGSLVEEMCEGAPVLQTSHL